MTERTAKAFLMTILTVVSILIAWTVVDKQSNPATETLKEAQSDHQSSPSTSAVYTLSTSEVFQETADSPTNVAPTEAGNPPPAEDPPSQTLSLFLQQIELESKLMNETNADEQSALRSQIESVKQNRLSIYRSN